MNAGVYVHPSHAHNSSSLTNRWSVKTPSFPRNLFTHFYLPFFFFLFLVAGTHEIIQKNIHSFLTIFGMIVVVLIHFKSKCTSFSRCWTCFQLLICYWIALFWKIVDLIDYNERESPFYSLNCWFFILTFVILYNETIIQLFFTECLLLFLYRYCLCPVS